MSNRENLLLVGLAAAGLLFLWSRTRSGEAAVQTAVDTGADVTEAAAEVVAEIRTGLMRGERNNNPGNIVKGELWQGLAIDQPDSRFATFTDPVYGIRALAKTLLSYQRRYGINTVAQAISRWAPSTENDTGAYVGAVASEIGVSPNQQLNFADPQILSALATAIIRHENGRVIYDPGLIATGVNAALG